MKPCQLCGACSWGEIKADLWLDLAVDSLVTETMDPRTFIWGKDVSLFRRCDGCGSFAALVLIDEHPSREASRLMSPPPARPLDQAMLQVHNVIAASMPEPEIRTERLVRALLASPMAEKSSAQEIVRLIRDIEKELDWIPEDLKSLNYWAAFQFSDRVALETWVAAGLHDTDCPTNLERPLARQFADWVQERQR